MKVRGRGVIKEILKNSKKGGRYAVIAACAAGGHGVGMLVEAYK